ncbi:5'-methylthioadenosine/S-adenosylhomocysteine nucleosidase [Leminorella richardii]|uniref:5'-methylthioadenosine/S-adenosylhomocysteine nucleosidase n=1 Tax=Leminorella richardii TaxID=158841 RepID=A0A2X4XLX8_9GAMM|nr:purine nucleoside permease [Leminorella richardii]SQI40925.1 5'-methylthioadenosine/S-adenosylhomocysteine nucleosidase [Leminorella richardii]
MFKKSVSTLVFLPLLASGQALANEAPINVKVFIGAMFEIGQNTGDKAGEFQNWYEKYFKDSKPITVKGAASPVFCNDDGVCGSVLGMGKVASSSSMQAILLNPQLDMSKAYYIISGVAGTPPSRGTIGDVSWASWAVDYDLGHRWAPEEGLHDGQTFMPRKGYENIRRYQFNPILVSWAMKVTGNTKLEDSEGAQKYRQRYPDANARRAPKVLTGTHMTGDTFFHGPGMSKEAQYIAKLYGADDYLMTEMEIAAITQVIAKTEGSTQRILSLRGAVNFDQGNPKETTLEHLDPAPGQTAGGFKETVENIAKVGGEMTDYIVAHWDTWQNGVPPLK